jgi:hypothetical protein
VLDEVIEIEYASVVEDQIAFEVNPAWFTIQPT